MKDEKENGSGSAAPLGTKYETVTVKSALPVWIAAAVWVVAAIILPMHRILIIILTAILSAAAGITAKKLLPVETRRVAVPFASGNLDLDAMVNELNRIMEAIEADRGKIADGYPSAAEEMREINRQIELIRDDIVAQPEDMKLIRRFMNYYLPTTVKLTDKYAYISTQGDNDNIAETRTAIESALAQIKDAFKKQYNALFADDALDITTDVTVLEAMMKRDNLN